MVRSFSILLTLIYLVATFQQGLVGLAFLYHAEYIKTQVCENRFEVASSCQGKCYLKRQLNTAIDQAQTQNTSGQTADYDFFETVVHLPAQSFQLPQNYLVFIKQIIPNSINYFILIIKLFHPPPEL